jgi:hypothetical protein
LLFYAKDCPEEQATFTYTCTQNELVADLIEEMDVKTLQRTAIPMLRLLGFIEVDGSSYRYCYEVHLDLIQHAINHYKQKEQLDKILIVSMNKQLDKYRNEIDKCPIQLDKILIELEKCLIPFRQITNSKRGRPSRPKADAIPISKSLDNLDILDTLDRESIVSPEVDAALSSSHDIFPVAMGSRKVLLDVNEADEQPITEEVDEETAKREVPSLPGSPLTTGNPLQDRDTQNGDMRHAPLAARVPDTRPAGLPGASHPGGDTDLQGPGRGDALAEPVSSEAAPPPVGDGGDGTGNGGGEGRGGGEQRGGTGAGTHQQIAPHSTPARISGLPLAPIPPHGIAPPVQRQGDAGRAVGTPGLDSTDWPVAAKTKREMKPATKKKQGGKVAPPEFTLTLEEQALYDAWCSLFKVEVPMNKAIYHAVQQLVTPVGTWSGILGESQASVLKAIKNWLFENDKNCYYKGRDGKMGRGVKLYDIAREFEGWQSEQQRRLEEEERRKRREEQARARSNGHLKPVEASSTVSLPVLAPLRIVGGRR